MEESGGQNCNVIIKYIFLQSAVDKPYVSILIDASLHGLSVAFSIKNSGFIVVTEKLETE